MKARHAGGTLAEYNIGLPHKSGLRLAIDAQTHNIFVYSGAYIHVTNTRCWRSIALPLFRFNVSHCRISVSFITRASLNQNIRCPATDCHRYQFRGSLSRVAMNLRISLFLALLYNCLASSLTPLGTMPGATIAPGRGLSAISATKTAVKTTCSSIGTSAPQSTTTAAPLTYNRFGFRRQECFNDQGFRVNCATWTGYYYTWGPPGNPYEGGPGQGGGGGSGYTTVVVGGSGKASTVSPTFLLWLMSLCVVLTVTIL